MSRLFSSCPRTESYSWKLYSNSIAKPRWNKILNDFSKLRDVDAKRDSLVFHLVTLALISEGRALIWVGPGGILFSFSWTSFLTWPHESQACNPLQLVLTMIHSYFWLKEEEDSVGLSPGRERFTTVSQTSFSSLKDAGVWSPWRLGLYMKFMRPL